VKMTWNGPDCIILGYIMPKTFKETRIRTCYLYCPLFFSKVKQLLSLILKVWGFELYFHRNRPEEAMELSNPDANYLNLLNDIIQAVTFLPNVKQSRDKPSLMLNHCLSRSWHEMNRSLLKWHWSFMFLLPFN